MIRNVVTAPGISHKLLPKFKGPYEVKKVLDRDRYVIGDIVGFQLSNRPFTGIFSTDRMKPWIRAAEPHCEDEVGNDETEHGRADHQVRMAEL